ncbi:atos homolog protein B [Petromyzon marinus]|uniref:Protein FAM214B n=1 Tax=Petromyzon marinus TaxID=7757 RepID=A0AAJ7X8Z3_PETMA|nr:protein FAM214B [Petromyzon marinus]XP_032824466.1 protein FAM214B [Petromyzon marinus]XP_032824467.1 protein FAM214B [Petromyzon marinus]XP_032824468.1 protein FAM214B [Petromyzon marinus]
MRFNISELPPTSRDREEGARHPDRPAGGVTAAPEAPPPPRPSSSPCDEDLRPPALYGAPLPPRSERTPPQGKAIVGKLLLTYVCSGAAAAREGPRGAEGQLGRCRTDPGPRSPPAPSAHGGDDGGPTDGMAGPAPGRRAPLGHGACENGAALGPSVHRRQIVANITEHLALCGPDPPAGANRVRGTQRPDDVPMATPAPAPPADVARGPRRTLEPAPRFPKRLRSASPSGAGAEGDGTPESWARRGGATPEGVPARTNPQQALAKAAAVKRKLLMAPGDEEPAGEGGPGCRSPPTKRSVPPWLPGLASWHHRLPTPPPPSANAPAQHSDVQVPARRCFPECPDRPSAVLRTMGLFGTWRGVARVDGGRESPTPLPLPKPRAPHHLGLLGSFEESALQGRLPPAGYVDGFTVELGASGSFCPRHASLPVLASFFSVAEDAAPSPYLGVVDLRPLGVRGYQVPRAGTIQMTLFNPSGSVVKMFVVIYDLRDMPPEHHTFLRQRTFSVPVGRRPPGGAAATASAPAAHDPLPTTTTTSSSSSSTAHRALHYLIHLRFLSSRSGKLFLHSDVRLLFSRKSLDADSGSVELKSFTEAPHAPRFSPRH